MIAGFDDVEIDLDRVEIRRRGTIVAVQPQVFDVIEYLLERRDRVVPRAELLDNVWGDRFVSESALTSRIKSARRALGDDGERQAVIRTVQGRGYRFVADVIDVTKPAATRAPLPVAAHADESVTASDGAGRARNAAWPIVGRGGVIERTLTSIDGGRSVALVGQGRVGTSTVLGEVVAELRSRGRLVVVAAAADPTIALSSLAHALPDDVIESMSAPQLSADLVRTALWQRARGALAVADDEPTTIIAIDDLERLDPFSSSILLSLMSSGEAIGVIAHLHRPATGGGAASDLGQVDLVDLVEVQPLDEADVDALLHRRLAGPIDLDTLRLLTEASGGAPGLLIDVVESSLAAGVLVRDDDVWRLTAPPTSGSVGDWPPAGLSKSAVDAAGRLAMLSSVPIDVVDRVADAADIDALDDLHLLALDDTSTNAAVRIADPILRGLIVDSMPPLRKVRERTVLVRDLDDVPKPPAMVASMVGWGDDVVDLLGSAEIGRSAVRAVLEGDLGSAEALVDAIDGTGQPIVGVIRAEIAFGRGQLERAIDLLAAVDFSRLDDAAVALGLRRRSSLELVGQEADGDETVRWMRHEAQRHAGVVADSLSARVLSLLAAIHRYDDVIAAHAGLAHLRGADRLEADAALAFAHAGQGRFHRALDMARAIRGRLAEAPTLWAADLRDVSLLLECTSLQQLGDIEQAAEVVRHDLPIGRVQRLGFSPAVAADIESEAGRPRSAREYIRPARTAVVRRSYPQYAAIVDAVGARCELMLGHRDAALELLDSAQALTARAVGAAASRAAAWITEVAAELDQPIAEDFSDDLATRSRSTGATLSEIETLCVTATASRTPDAAIRHLPRIEAAAAAFDGPLWPIRVEEIRLIAEGRSTASLGDAYRQLGYIRRSDRAMRRRPAPT